MATPSIGEFKRREDCRGCRSKNVATFMDYGDLPLAGGFLLPGTESEEKLYPLDLAVCNDCSLVQVLNVVDPAVLFGDYRYLSSVTQTLSQHFRDYARQIGAELSGTDGFVLEIGCNDGVLLAPLKELGIRAVGVDAAENIAEIARGRGLEVVRGFFTPSLAAELASKYGRPDVITASNVFAHIDDLDSVMQGVDELLSPDGIFTVEVHYIRDLVETFQFDTVYHEHLCYYSLRALAVLFNRFGFEIVAVERLSMHGGAVRVSARRKLSRKRVVGPDVACLFAEEHELGLDSQERYVRFGHEAVEHRDRLREFLAGRRGKGRSLSAYGAAGRATTLLNYCGIGRAQLEYVVDESPLRAGRLVPGVHVPIVGRATFRDRPTDDCLITAWNYKDEIVAKEAAYLGKGGCFLTPMPSIQAITG